MLFLAQTCPPDAQCRFLLEVKQIFIWSTNYTQIMREGFCLTISNFAQSLDPQTIPCSFWPSEGCLPIPLGVNLSILQTVESRTPLLMSAYLWDKYSFKKALMLNKFEMKRG